MRCEACGYRFLFEIATVCPGCGAVRKASDSVAVVSLSGKEISVDPRLLILLTEKSIRHVDELEVKDKRIAELEAHNAEIQTAMGAWKAACDHCRVERDALRLRVVELEFQLAAVPVDPPTPRAFPAGALSAIGGDPRRIGGF
jgi:hypothetical protein